jgi:hypothetical protein
MRLEEAMEERVDAVRVAAAAPPMLRWRVTMVETAMT